MSADYTLSAAATMDAKKFKSGARQAEDSLESLRDKCKSFGDGLEGIGSKMTNGITKPALGVVSAIASITFAKGFSRLSAIDDAKAKLTGLGHSAESVETIMDSALASVKGTSYGLGDAATIAASAVAANVKEGEELTRYLSRVADVSAIAGASLGDMGYILNKVQTNTKASTEEMNQLADRGIPIFQWLAQAADTSVEEVRKMLSKGEISSDLFFQAIDQNIGGAAKVMGNASLKNSAENLVASISRIGANFLDAGGKGGGFFSQLKPLVQEATGYLGELENDATGLGEQFGKSFADMVQGGRDLAASVQEWYGELSPAWRNIVSNLADVSPLILVGAGPAFKLLGKTISGVGVAAGLMSSSFKVIKGTTSGLVKTVRTLSDDVGYTRIAFSDARSAGAKFGGAMKAAGTQVKASTTAMKLGAAASRTLKASLGSIGLVAAAAAAAGLAVAFVEAHEKSQIFKKATTGLRDATDSLNTKMYESKNALGGIGTEKAKEKFTSLRDEIDKTAGAQAELAQQISEKWGDINADAKLVEDYISTIETLTTKTGESGEKAALSADEQAKLVAAVAGLNEVCGTSYSVIDAQMGILDTSTGTIINNTEAWLANAKAQAAQEQLVDVQKKINDARLQQAQAAKDAKNAEAEYNDALSRQEPYMDSYISNLSAKNDALNKANDLVKSAEDAEADLIGILEESTRKISTTKDALGEFISTQEGWGDALESNGYSVDVVSQKLSELGFSTSDLQGKSAESLLALVGSYDASAAEIIAKCDELGINVPDKVRQAAQGATQAVNEEAPNTAQAANASGDGATAAFVQGMNQQASAAVIAALGITGMTLDQFAAAADENGVHGNDAITEFANSMIANAGKASDAVFTVGNYVNTAMDTLEANIGKSGTKSGTLYAANIKGTASVTTGAAGVISGSVLKAITPLEAKLAASGKTSVNRFGSGISSGVGQVGSASSQIANATTAMSSNTQNAYTWGAHQGHNYAGGLRSAIGAIASASMAAAAAAANPLKHTVPKIGPLKGDDEWGLHQGQNYTKGIKRSIPEVRTAVDEMAAAASLMPRKVVMATSVTGDLSLRGRSEAVTNYYTIEGIDVTGEPDIERAVETMINYVKRAKGVS